MGDSIHILKDSRSFHHTHSHSHYSMDGTCCNIIDVIPVKLRKLEYDEISLIVPENLCLEYELVALLLRYNISPVQMMFDERCVCFNKKIAYNKHYLKFLNSYIPHKEKLSSKHYNQPILSIICVRGNVLHAMTLKRKFKMDFYYVGLKDNYLYDIRKLPFDEVYVLTLRKNIPWDNFFLVNYIGSDRNHKKAMNKLFSQKNSFTHIKNRTFGEKLEQKERVQSIKYEESLVKCSNKKLQTTITESKECMEDLNISDMCNKIKDDFNPYEFARAMNFTEDDVKTDDYHMIMSNYHRKMKQLVEKTRNENYIKKIEQQNWEKAQKIKTDKQNNVMLSEHKYTYLDLLGNIKDKCVAKAKSLSQMKWTFGRDKHSIKKFCEIKPERLNEFVQDYWIRQCVINDDKYIVTNTGYYVCINHTTKKIFGKPERFVKNFNAYKHYETYIVKPDLLEVLSAVFGEDLNLRMNLRRKKFTNKRVTKTAIEVSEAFKSFQKMWIKPSVEDQWTAKDWEKYSSKLKGVKVICHGGSTISIFNQRVFTINHGYCKDFIKINGKALHKVETLGVACVYGFKSFEFAKLRHGQVAVMLPQSSPVIRISNKFITSEGAMSLGTGRWQSQAGNSGALVTQDKNVVGMVFGKLTTETNYGGNRETICYVPNIEILYNVTYKQLFVSGKIVWADTGTGKTSGIIDYMTFANEQHIGAVIVSPTFALASEMCATIYQKTGVSAHFHNKMVHNFPASINSWDVYTPDVFIHQYMNGAIGQTRPIIIDEVDVCNPKQIAGFLIMKSYHKGPFYGMSASPYGINEFRECLKKNLSWNYYSSVAANYPSPVILNTIVLSTKGLVGIYCGTKKDFTYIMDALGKFYGIYSTHTRWGDGNVTTIEEADVLVLTGQNIMGITFPIDPVAIILGGHNATPDESQTVQYHVASAVAQTIGRAARQDRNALVQIHAAYNFIIQAATLETRSKVADIITAFENRTFVIPQPPEDLRRVRIALFKKSARTYAPNRVYNLRTKVVSVKPTAGYKQTYVLNQVANQFYTNPLKALSLTLIGATATYVGYTLWGYIGIQSLKVENFQSRWMACSIFSCPARSRDVEEIQYNGKVALRNVCPGSLDYISNTNFDEEKTNGALNFFAYINKKRWAFRRAWRRFETSLYVDYHMLTGNYRKLNAYDAVRTITDQLQQINMSSNRSRITVGNVLSLCEHMKRTKGIHRPEKQWDGNVNVSDIIYLTRDTSQYDQKAERARKDNYWSSRPTRFSKLNQGNLSVSVVNDNILHIGHVKAIDALDDFQYFQDQIDSLDETGHNLADFMYGYNLKSIHPYSKRPYPKYLKAGCMLDSYNTGVFNTQMIEYEYDADKGEIIGSEDLDSELDYFQFSRVKTGKIDVTNKLINLICMSEKNIEGITDFQYEIFFDLMHTINSLYGYESYWGIVKSMPYFKRDLLYHRADLTELLDMLIQLAKDPEGHFFVNMKTFYINYLIENRLPLHDFLLDVVSHHVYLGTNQTHILLENLITQIDYELDVLGDEFSNLFRRNKIKLAQFQKYQSMSKLLKAVTNMPKMDASNPTGIEKYVADMAKFQKDIALLSQIGFHLRIFDAKYAKNLNVRKDVYVASHYMFTLLEANKEMNLLTDVYTLYYLWLSKKQLNGSCVYHDLFALFNRMADHGFISEGPFTHERLILDRQLMEKTLVKVPKQLTIRKYYNKMKLKWKKRNSVLHMRVQFKLFMYWCYDTFKMKILRKMNDNPMSYRRINSMVKHIITEKKLPIDFHYELMLDFKRIIRHFEKTKVNKQPITANEMNAYIIERYYKPKKLKVKNNRRIFERDKYFNKKTFNYFKRDKYFNKKPFNYFRKSKRPYTTTWCSAMSIQKRWSGTYSDRPIIDFPWKFAICAIASVLISYKIFSEDNRMGVYHNILPVAPEAFIGIYDTNQTYKVPQYHTTFSMPLQRSWKGMMAKTTFDVALWAGSCAYEMATNPVDYFFGFVRCKHCRKQIDKRIAFIHYNNYHMQSTPYYRPVIKAIFDFYMNMAVLGKSNVMVIACKYMDDRDALADVIAALIAFRSQLTFGVPGPGQLQIIIGKYQKKRRTYILDKSRLVVVPSNLHQIFIDGDLRNDQIDVLVSGPSFMEKEYKYSQHQKEFWRGGSYAQLYGLRPTSRRDSKIASFKWNTRFRMPPPEWCTYPTNIDNAAWDVFNNTFISGLPDTISHVHYNRTCDTPFEYLSNMWSWMSRIWNYYLYPHPMSYKSLSSKFDFDKYFTINQKKKLQLIDSIIKKPNYLSRFVKIMKFDDNYISRFIKPIKINQLKEDVVLPVLTKDIDVPAFHGEKQDVALLTDIVTTTTNNIIITLVKDNDVLEEMISVLNIFEPSVVSYPHSGYETEKRTDPAVLLQSMFEDAKQYFKSIMVCKDIQRHIANKRVFILSENTIIKLKPKDKKKKKLLRKKLAKLHDFNDTYADEFIDILKFMDNVACTIKTTIGLREVYSSLSVFFFIESGRHSC
eukprot:71425_1